MIGNTLGSYRVVSQLGEGGMGVVYVAEHPLIGRRAAVKLLLPEYSKNRTLVERFFNEARAATVIKHRGIVDIFDFGFTEDGQAFIVMELLEGESLAARIRRGRLGAEEATRIARQVASALSAAHEAGIVHRDLKPDNVFIIHDSEVLGGERIKVLDFGIAKLSKHGATSASSTRTGEIMGSPFYMAPEQCRGAAAVDARADIYSLGCVMYEMVSGRQIFDSGAVGEILAKQIYEAPHPPSTFATGIPTVLESVVMRCLAKQPEARFQSMRAVISALDLASQGRYATAAGEPGPGAANEAAATLVANDLPPSFHTPPPGFLTAPAQTTLSRVAGELAGARSAPEPGGRRRWGLLGATVGVIVVAGGVFALTRGGGDEDAGQRGSPEPRGSEAGATAPAPSAESPGAPARPADAGVALPATVEIAISSEPSSAAICRVADGVCIGETPFSARFARSDGSLELRIEHQDFHDRPLTVSLATDGVHEVVLDPLPADGAGSVRASGAEHRAQERRAGVASKRVPKEAIAKPAAARPEPPTAGKTDARTKPVRRPPNSKEWGTTVDPLAE